MCEISQGVRSLTTGDTHGKVETETAVTNTFTSKKATKIGGTQCSSEACATLSEYNAGSNQHAGSALSNTCSAS